MPKLYSQSRDLPAPALIPSYRPDNPVPASERDENEVDPCEYFLDPVELQCEASCMEVSICWRSLTKMRRQIKCLRSQLSEKKRNFG